MLKPRCSLGFGDPVLRIIPVPDQDLARSYGADHDASGLPGPRREAIGASGAFEPSPAQFRRHNRLHRLHRLQLLRWLEPQADAGGADVGVTEPQATLRICGAQIRRKIEVEIEISGSCPAIGAERNA